MVVRKRSFAEKLTALITQARESGREISYARIAAQVKEAGGPTMTAQYIQQLATGTRVNPKLHYVEALAGCFGVPAAYFFDDEVADRVDVQLRRLQEERQRLERIREGDRLAQIATRAGELSPEGWQQVTNLIDVMYRLEVQGSTADDRDQGRGKPVD